MAFFQIGLQILPAAGEGDAESVVECIRRAGYSVRNDGGGYLSVVGQGDFEANKSYIVGVLSDTFGDDIPCSVG